MTPEPDYEARLRAAYATWADSRGASIDHWVAMFADDCELGSLAGGAPGVEFTRTARGPEGVRAFLEGLTRDLEMVDADMHTFVRQGERVVALGSVHWKNRATGKLFSSPKADAWTFRGDQAVAFFEYYDTAALAAAAAR